jgi:N utilization substance protein A
VGEDKPAIFVIIGFTMAKLARTEFSSALSAIAAESGLDTAIVLDTIKQAILAAFRRDARERGEVIEDIEKNNYEIDLDPESGEAHVFLIDKGEKKDVTPPGFGRIAVQTAKQVILQKLREAEKDAILAYYRAKIGSLVSGVVLRFDGPNVRVDLGRAEGVLPPEERVPNEKFNLNQRVTFLVKKVEESGSGRRIILSRSDPDIVKALFAREVPEVASGAVEIRAIARDPGVRTKVAVSSSHSGVDPVGSCVGQKGVRVQAVINELNNEKIDVIPWTDDTKSLIASSLSPATDMVVNLDEEKKEATVLVPEDQLSLAIGKDGSNVRLASKLTGWEIKIEPSPLLPTGSSQEKKGDEKEVKNEKQR